MPTIGPLHVEVDGQGPPVMLIAGMASDSASWGPLVAQLADRFTVIRPDNRGTGRSAMGRLSVAGWADDALNVAAHLGLGPVAVVGHSLGGIIALHMAATAPDAVSRIALLASAPVHLPRNTALFQTLLALRAPGQPPDLWLRAFLPWLFHPRFFAIPGQFDAAVAQSLAYPHAQTPAGMAAQLAALDGHDPAPLALTVAHPVIALLAEHDLLIPGDIARAALAPLRNLDLRVIPDAGHSVHWDASAATLAALIPFLEGPA
jgi:pimeloyl-ACP methyl ester carboxylesterase